MRITFFGQQLDAAPILAHGLGIVCRGKPGQIIVLEHQADDRVEFWRTWRDLGGEDQGICFEGGEPFKAPLQAQPNWFARLTSFFRTR